MVATQGNPKVVECAPTFEPDELEGFERATVSLPSEDDGELVATLVRTVGPEEDARPAIVYVHGFVDYFFQAHLARAFEKAGFRFYALDLRRHGRSLRPGNRYCMARSIEDFFQELDWAVGFVRARHPAIAGLVAHSTGGLIASLYLDARKNSALVARLVLNSPFLKFSLSTTNQALMRVVARTARLMPHFVLPQKIGAAYGKTLHVSEQGEWSYDLEKKPIEGFPMYSGWFRMIRQGHARVAGGIDVPVPILSLHSDRSSKSFDEPVDGDWSCDLVLDVEHIKQLSPRLGNDVRLVEIPGGVHDLTLSRQPARDLAIEEMVSFVKADD